MAKEKFKTYGNVFDEFIKRRLFKLESEGHFERLEGPVQIGKEANVFSALTKDGKRIVKIYRLETCDFKRMYDYIKHDSRYIDMRRTRRNIIFSWTQREFRNLMIARDAGINVPTPYTFKDNIIVMEYIGKGAPAPQLKDSYPDDPDGFFQAVVGFMKKLWKAGLVHADLSQFNILNDSGKPVLIDFSQSTTTDSMAAKEYLERDIRNICNFFKKKGLEKDPSEIQKLVVS